MHLEDCSLQAAIFSRASQEFSLTVSMQRYSWVLFPAVGLNFHTVDDFDASDFRTRRTLKSTAHAGSGVLTTQGIKARQRGGSVRRDIRSFDKAGVDAAVSFLPLGASRLVFFDTNRITDCRAAGGCFQSLARIRNTGRGASVISFVAPTVFVDSNPVNDASLSGFNASLSRDITFFVINKGLALIVLLGGGNGMAVV